MTFRQYFHQRHPELPEGRWSVFGEGIVAVSHRFMDTMADYLDSAGAGSPATHMIREAKEARNG